MENEALVRLGAFGGLFLLFAALETVAPRRVRKHPRRGRWLTNWGISIANVLALRALALGLPLLAVGAALDAEAQGWGLFNQLGWPLWLEMALAVLIFDFAIWLQHLITHKVPLLWRLHRVHHADVDFDVTTAIRFHPVEIALSMLLKIGLVYLLGPAAWAVVIFEVLLNGTAMFNHANLRLPLGLDAALRKVLVTPDMHRVHHSVHRHEHDSNYGFSLSLWDRLFRTYRAQPEAGHDGMTIGLEWQDTRPTRLGWSLWLPFSKR
ncbi:MAG: sterol desaturase family protein [Marinovum algicola]|jgi:sterol desaturase/sphingolipid hydroxylase (fatty acid hydroxylase superfamily)|uniref:Sterol desaturase/sphingolipid hydroxylase, fatty acid hydroxylase superfamily n=1 Tax=Marinovum algicola TaxID=42444 RepID=A0A975W5X3_9RHOB|nr:MULTISPECIES: sterol desaturase family protein [Marinovum]AKO95688.1 Sterol desaturase [Marinovum algicola DG 898]MDD9742147.1 sterol desaturase family protein [Marinovum sp. SP66]MDD9743500.1 sterol desaturase family protein [Marinovum sp. PR37]SEI51326.1 Sterol desaturase/sphingolipid hydroxylase, fatty acid hydroxylase superfamily [Marinovum algicola]SLN30435.1 Fatty acid hydroxylase superfamily protein [Marinovum algicola]